MNLTNSEPSQHVTPLILVPSTPYILSLGEDRDVFPIHIYMYTHFPQPSSTEQIQAIVKMNLNFELFLMD